MSWTCILEWLTHNHPGLKVAPDPSDVDGLPVIEHLGNPAAELRAVRQAAALLVTPQWAPLLVEGKDAAEYLHRRLSHSIRELAVGQGRYALLLAGDGHFQAELLVYRAHEGFVVLIDHAARKAVFQLIEKYTLMDDVRLDRMWPGEAVLALVGPQAPALLAALLDPPAKAESLDHRRFSAFMTITLNGLPCRIFSDPRWPFPYYNLSVPAMAAQRLTRLLADHCAREGGGLAGLLALRMARIDAGIPRQGLDLNEDVIPIEAQLEHAIDRDKGCFPGQEVIARIANLGHPARLLLRFEMDGDCSVAPHDRVMVEGEDVGQITSVAGWAGLGYTLALGYVKWPYREVRDATILTGPGARFHARCSSPI